VGTVNVGPSEYGLDCQTGKIGLVPGATMFCQEEGDRRAARHAPESVAQGVVNAPPILTSRTKDAPAFYTRPPAGAAVMKIGPGENLGLCKGTTTHWMSTTFNGHWAAGFRTQISAHRKLAHVPLRRT
jgi:hypothetical protein